MSSADYHQQQQQQENMGGAMGMGMMGGHHLSTKTDVLTVLRAVQMPNSGLEIKDRMWLKITIPNAFLGQNLWCTLSCSLKVDAFLFSDVEIERWWLVLV